MGHFVVTATFADAYVRFSTQRPSKNLVPRTVLIFSNFTLDIKKP